MRRKILGLLMLGLACPSSAMAEGTTTVNLTTSTWGWLSVAVFCVGYLFVVLEEKTHLKKSIPMMIAAGVIWTFVAIAFRLSGDMETAGASLEHAMMEYGALLLFLLSAMAYVNTLQERNVFEVIRYKLLAAGLSQRSLFWATGTAAFFLSPVLDNLTTALVMCSVAVAVGAGNPRFVGLSAISIVIAANAGGAYSPFGDITTLMVWQAGKAEFFEFFSIFLPALVNWLVPATLMSLAIRPSSVRVENEPVQLKQGAVPIMLLFAVTVALAVLAHQLFHIPSAMGMMLGLGLLKLYGYFLSRREHLEFQEASVPSGLDSQVLLGEWKPRHKPFDTFVSVKRAEWDTLLFFFGVLMSVAGLAQLGYLAQVSVLSYGNLGATQTNVLIGFLSAVIDNIPVMYAVLQMSPEMSHGQWLLVTLTAGTGGSLLSVGSAAGVALMGFAKVADASGNKVDAYTFFGHLKWTPVILLGYAASVQMHIWLHADVAALW